VLAACCISFPCSSGVTTAFTRAALKMVSSSGCGAARSRLLGGKAADAGRRLCRRLLFRFVYGAPISSSSAAICRCSAINESKEVSGIFFWRRGRSELLAVVVAWVTLTNVRA